MVRASLGGVNAFREILATGAPDEPLRDWTKAELATAICDRIALLAGGGIRFVGSPAEFRGSPDPLVRAFADRRAAEAAATVDMELVLVAAMVDPPKSGTGTTLTAGPHVKVVEQALDARDQHERERADGGDELEHRGVDRHRRRQDQGVAADRQGCGGRRGQSAIESGNARVPSWGAVRR